MRRPPTILFAALLSALACSPGEGPASGEIGAVSSDDRLGRLVIVGGSLDRDNDAVYRAVLDGRSGSGPLCVLPTASGVPERSLASAVEAFGEHGAEAVEGIYVTTDNPDAASDPAVVARLRGCSGFWFTGGVQSRVVEVFRPEGIGTPAYDALIERFEAGAVVAGSSAGAAMLPPRMIAGGGSAEAVGHGVVSNGEEDGVIVATGMGFFPHAVLDQHFLSRGRIGRLLVASLAGVGGGVGLGIDENTAVVVEGLRATVVGESGAILVDARDADRTEMGNGGRDIRLHLVGSGDTFDLRSLEVTAAPDKVTVEATAGSVEAPEDPFARWAFLKLLSELSASPDASVEMTVSGHRMTLEKAGGFRARSYGRDGVEGTPAGLSAGPFLVALVPEGT